MSPLGRSLLLSMIAFGVSVPALAQPKADAGSGPTNGATSTNDAGSGPTKGAKPNSQRRPAIPTVLQKTALASVRGQNQPEARSP
jgi:hypothetical protein